MDKRRMRNLNFEKLITKTGVPLYVMNLPFAQSVAAGIFIKAGTREERWPTEAGLAHALEHMSFQGTKNFATSKDLSAYLEEVGGGHNAWTASEGTFYHNRMPIPYKERGFKILGEMLTMPTLPNDKIPIEMKNIVEEIHRAYDDPEHFLGILDQQFVYGNHPLGKLTLGTIESVSAFTQESFIEFRKRYYHPGNYTFFAVGNITSQQALQEFEKILFEPDNIPMNDREVIPLSEKGERTFVYRKQLEQVHITLSAPLGKGTEKSALSASMFATMLNGGMSFPLFQEVRDKRGLCYSIYAGTSRDSDVGEFTIGIGTDPKRYQEAIDVSLQLVEQCSNDEALLKKAKDLRLGQLALRFEHPGQILRSAASSTMVNGCPKGYDDFVKEILDVTIEDVTTAVKTYLKPEQFRRVLLVPESLEMKS